MKGLNLQDFEQGVRDYWTEIGRRSDAVQLREKAYEQLAARFAHRKPPHFEREELKLIVKWKHTDRRWCSRSLAGLDQVEDDRLAALTGQINDQEVQELLTLFHGAIAGVGIATISAIITAARPDLFAVIDDFALRAIYFHYRPEWVCAVHRDKDGKFQPMERDYIQYVGFCRERAKELGALGKKVWTPRRVEMALWGIGKGLAWRTIRDED
jgi:hypothetical protein